MQGRATLGTKQTPWKLKQWLPSLMALYPHTIGTEDILFVADGDKVYRLEKGRTVSQVKAKNRYIHQSVEDVYQAVSNSIPDDVEIKGHLVRVMLAYLTTRLSPSETQNLRFDKPIRSFRDFQDLVSSHGAPDSTHANFWSSDGHNMFYLDSPNETLMNEHHQYIKLERGDGLSLVIGDVNEALKQKLTDLTKIPHLPALKKTSLEVPENVLNLLRDDPNGALSALGVRPLPDKGAAAIEAVDELPMGSYLLKLDPGYVKGLKGLSDRLVDLFGVNYDSPLCHFVRCMAEPQPLTERQAHLVMLGSEAASKGTPLLNTQMGAAIIAVLQDEGGRTENLPTVLRTIFKYADKTEFTRIYFDKLKDIFAAPTLHAFEEAEKTYQRFFQKSERFSTEIFRHLGIHDRRLGDRRSVKTSIQGQSTEATTEILVTVDPGFWGVSGNWDPKLLGLWQALITHPEARALVKAHKAGGYPMTQQAILLATLPNLVSPRLAKEMMGLLERHEIPYCDEEYRVWCDFINDPDRTVERLRFIDTVATTQCPARDTFVRFAAEHAMSETANLSIETFEYEDVWTTHGLVNRLTRSLTNKEAYGSEALTREDQALLIEILENGQDNPEFSKVKNLFIKSGTGNPIDLEALRLHLKTWKYQALLMTTKLGSISPQLERLIHQHNLSDIETAELYEIMSRLGRLGFTNIPNLETITKSRESLTRFLNLSVQQRLYEQIGWEVTLRALISQDQPTLEGYLTRAAQQLLQKPDRDADVYEKEVKFDLRRRCDDKSDITCTEACFLDMALMGLVTSDEDEMAQQERVIKSVVITDFFKAQKSHIDLGRLLSRVSGERRCGARVGFISADPIEINGVDLFLPNWPKDLWLNHFKMVPGMSEYLDDGPSNYSEKRAQLQNHIYKVMNQTDVQRAEVFKESCNSRMLFGLMLSRMRKQKEWTVKQKAIAECFSSMLTEGGARCLEDDFEWASTESIVRSMTQSIGDSQGIEEAIDHVFENKEFAQGLMEHIFAKSEDMSLRSCIETYWSQHLRNKFGLETGNTVQEISQAIVDKHFELSDTHRDAPNEEVLTTFVKDALHTLLHPVIIEDTRETPLTDWEIDNLRQRVLGGVVDASRLSKAQIREAYNRLRDSDGPDRFSRAAASRLSPEEAADTSPINESLDAFRIRILLSGESRPLAPNILSRVLPALEAEFHKDPERHFEHVVYKPSEETAMTQRKLKEAVFNAKVECKEALKDYLDSVERVKEHPTSTIVMQPLGDAIMQAEMDDETRVQVMGSVFDHLPVLLVSPIELFESLRGYEILSEAVGVRLTKDMDLRGLETFEELLEVWVKKHVPPERAATVIDFIPEFIAMEDQTGGLHTAYVKKQIQGLVNQQSERLEELAETLVTEGYYGGEIPVEITEAFTEVFSAKSINTMGKEFGKIAEFETAETITTTSANKVTTVTAQSKVKRTRTQATNDGTRRNVTTVIQDKDQVIGFNIERHYRS
eukprot:Blabericola_migrator_1__767@NODE_1191_length_5165_cov_152_844253_g660_i2_p1_GENE_NODE_1191_length_5165_cov_152_844253_g660_i2NODE_1191_length_5165_cov_152_844253_g660_i2_p1_ORF_typecomplete_len1486_score349_77PG_binding_2/PF08823_11/7_7e02PG_binding_2/PF08823_11/4_2e03PG_binding_2/PF08823_11/3_1GAPES4/PF17157_4/2_1GAPES4/PF17157_4/5_7e02SRP_SPB/PF02978_19/1_5_NODE_1191_length_5165_cov_152_844253_g660_i26415098